MSSLTQEQHYLEAFERYSDDLFRHAYFRLSDRERALDLVQDAFAKVWDYIGQGNTIDQFRPFLYRTLNNLIIDEYRKKKMTSLDALLEQEGVTEASFEDLKTDSLEALEGRLDAKRFVSELEAMPPQYRQMVVMRYFDELTPKEIAEITGESENVISVRIHRGLEWLRKNAHY